MPREYELLDTGIMDDNKYFDVVVELSTLLLQGGRGHVLLP